MLSTGGQSSCLQRLRLQRSRGARGAGLAVQPGKLVKCLLPRELLRRQAPVVHLICHLRINMAWHSFPVSAVWHSAAMACHLRFLAALPLLRLVLTHLLAPWSVVTLHHASMHARSRLRGLRRWRFICELLC